MRGPDTLCVWVFDSDGRKDRNKLPIYRIFVNLFRIFVGLHWALVVENGGNSDLLRVGQLEDIKPERIGVMVVWIPRLCLARAFE